MGTPARDFGRDRNWITAGRLRQRRGDLDLTQNQLVGRLAKMGLSLSDGAISAMENGQGIDTTKLIEFAVTLDCTISYLLGLTEDPGKWEPDQPLARMAKHIHRLLRDGFEQPRLALVPR